MELKTINETFTLEEYNNLLMEKGNMTWREFILQLTENRNKTIEIATEFENDS